MTTHQVYDRAKLLKLAAWSRLAPGKTAFVDPSGGMPPGAAPPMDPAMMMAGGGMPPEQVPPMAPAMMTGGAAGAPMPAAPPDAMPPPDPSVQAMGNEEMMRTIIRDEIQKALGGDGAGPVGQKKGNKIEELYQMLEMMREQAKEDKKIFIAALRSAGIEIPLGDILAIEDNRSGAPTPAAGQAMPGLSETMNPGLGGDAGGNQPGKIADALSVIDQLTKLAQTKDRLNRSALGPKLVHGYNPQEPELSYLAGLYR
jgi:hypothetical protein